MTKLRAYGDRRTITRRGKSVVKVYVGRAHFLADSNGETSEPRFLLWIDQPDTGSAHNDGNDGNDGWVPCHYAQRQPPEMTSMVNWRVAPPDRRALYAVVLDKSKPAERGNVVSMCRRHSMGKAGPCGGG